MTPDGELLDLLKRTYPDLNFAYGNRFKYRYPNHITLEKPPKNPENSPETAQKPENRAYTRQKNTLQAFHELGHALLKHKDYTTDVSRLKIECAAWEAGKTAFLKLQKSDKIDQNLKWDDDFVEDSLDTYRDWLHQKSTCKTCGLTRYQTEDGAYHCPRCENFT